MNYWIGINGCAQLKDGNQRMDLSGPIAFDLCGPRGAGQAIGIASHFLAEFNLVDLPRLPSCTLLSADDSGPTHRGTHI